MRSRVHVAEIVSSWTLAARLAAVLLAVAIVLGVACSGDSESSAGKLDNPDQTGTELVNQYITLLKNKDVDGLRAFISDAFIIQRADGSNDEKAAYLQNMPEIGDFKITDVTALQADDALIVRWFLTVDEVINGQTYSKAPAPRLSTFVYDDGSWRLTSHANFNAPDAATPPASPTTTGN
jgi:Tfp pilus assembly protein PilO